MIRDVLLELGEFNVFNLKQNGTHIHKPFIYSFYFFTAVRISNVMGITKYTIM